MELEAFEKELEVTTISAGDKRTSSPKPKPSSGGVSSSTEEGDTEQSNDPNPNHNKNGKGKEKSKPPQSEEHKNAMISERKKAAATANTRIQKKIDDKEIYLTTDVKSTSRTWPTLRTRTKSKRR